MNLPNSLTLARIISIPFFAYFLLVGMYEYASILFVLASLTDFLDGHLARKMNLVTNFGKFMDPTADKLLVYSALFIFIEKGLMSSIFVIIIVSRDFMINTLRSIAIEKNMVIPAMWSGKIKTTVQMLGIILIMALEYAEVLLSKTGGKSANFDSIIFATGLIMTIVTLYSGIDYMAKMKGILKN